MSIAMNLPNEEPAVLIQVINRQHCATAVQILKAGKEDLRKSKRENSVYINLKQQGFPLCAGFSLINIIAYFAELHNSSSKAIQVEFLLLAEAALLPFAHYIVRNHALPLQVFLSLDAMGDHLKRPARQPELLSIVLISVAEQRQVEAQS